jgi:hypothetical protein
LWQVAHDWPTVEFIRGATATKNVAFSPGAFVGPLVLMMNPVALPIWLAGLTWLLGATPARPFRALGVAYLAVLLLMTTQNAKPYYLAPMYPLLFAAGAVAIAHVAAAPARRALRPVAIAVVVLSGALFAPLAKPLLPVDMYVAYAAMLGIAPGTSARSTISDQALVCRRRCPGTTATGCGGPGHATARSSSSSAGDARITRSRLPTS